MTESYGGDIRREVRELAAAQPADGERSLEDLGPVYADLTHAVATAAGLTVETSFPSVRLSAQQENAARNQEVLSESITEDPAVALEGNTSHPCAVREERVDIDDDFTDTTEVRWLGFASIEAGLSYIEQYGPSVEIPGPGEFTGVFWQRTFFHNPYHREVAS